MSNKKRNPKTRFSTNRKKIEARFAHHFWSNRGDREMSIDTMPIVGFYYQNYENSLFFSTLRPDDLHKLLDQLNGGCLPLRPQQLMHFSDNYAPMVAGLFLAGYVEMTAHEGFHLAICAVMHAGMENEKMSLEICRYLIRKGMDWDTFKECSQLLADFQDHEQAMQTVSPIWREANSMHVAALLGDLLTEKPSIKNIKI